MDNWRTAIATSDDSHIWIHGYDVTDLMTRADFTDTVFLVLLQMASTQRRWRVCPPELCSDAEDRVDKLTLRYSIVLSDPADLTFADCVHRLVALDGSAGTVRRSESETRRNPFLNESMVLLNGLITNDKFCLSRVSRQKLRYARRPRTLPCQAVDSYAHPRDEEHRGGANEATVESPSSVSADHECRAAVGPGLPTSPGMDSAGPRSTCFVSPSSGSRGEI